jgi:hypothetical protein
MCEFHCIVPSGPRTGVRPVVGIYIVSFKVLGIERYISIAVSTLIDRVLFESKKTDGNVRTPRKWNSRNTIAQRSLLSIYP